MGINFDATIESILSKCEIDTNVITLFKETDNLDTVTSPYVDMVKYLKDEGVSVISYTSCKYELNKILRDVTYNLSSTVVFSIKPKLYYCKITTASYVTFLPLVTSRMLLSILKTYGVKCIAEKKFKSQCSKLDICLTELVAKGKSNINIPGLKPLADVCKTFKGSIIPWYKDTEEVKPDTNNFYISESSARFRGAEWFQVAQKDITLIGAGGIGSNIAVSLCRVMGSNTLYIYDDDKVEHKNLAGQNFGISDIGLEKARVVSNQCQNFNPEMEVFSEGRFNTRSLLEGITICGLDNMATRALVFSKWQPTEGTALKEKLLIDARLSAEKWQIFCITGDNKAAQKEYEDKWLFTDEDADSDVCSYKQTAFAAQMCASFVTNLYINFCTNLLKDEDDPTRRYLPFMTEYDASQMILRFKEVI